MTYIQAKIQELKPMKLKYHLEKDEFVYYEFFNKYPLFTKSTNDKFSPKGLDTFLQDAQTQVLSREWQEYSHTIYAKCGLDGTLFVARNSEDYWVFQVFADSQERIDEAWKQLSLLDRHQPPSQVGILKTDYSGLRVNYITMKKPKINLALNYGKDFQAVHKTLCKKLKDKTNGLYLLHGVPGTGKTTYLKYLMATLDRKMIVIPNSMIDSLDGPQLISLMMNHKNTVLVMEDAEAVLQSRDSGNSIASTLINISDGILGEILDVALICTFNVEKDNIDEALVRKGRLLLEHEFCPLSVEDAQKLLDHLGKKHTATEPMSLAEIYNVEDENGHKTKPRGKLGF